MPDRRKQLRAWLYAMTRLEGQLRLDQSRARNAMIRKAAAQFTATRQFPAFLLLEHRNRTAQNLTAAYQRTIPVFASMATRQIKSRRFERKVDTFARLAAEWITREALRKATLIADTDRDDVLAAINAGLEEGLGTEEIARNIRKVSQLTPFRAATIARTETHAAATFGSIESVREAEQELGVRMLKVWLPTMDARTRPDHAAMANHPPVPLDEKFTVGGEMMDRPGDPSASAKNIISCRCALAYQEEDQ
jgi:uncharacterized protein with gpF-like domain